MSPFGSTYREPSAMTSSFWSSSTAQSDSGTTCPLPAFACASEIVRVFPLKSYSRHSASASSLPVRETREPGTRCCACCRRLRRRRAERSGAARAARTSRVNPAIEQVSMRLSLPTRHRKTHSRVRTEGEPVRLAIELVPEQPQLRAGRLDSQHQAPPFGIADVALPRPRAKTLHADLCQPRKSRFHGHLMDTFGDNRPHATATGCNSKLVLKCLKIQSLVHCRRCERLQAVAGLNYMGCKGSRVQISALRPAFPRGSKISGGPMNGPISAAPLPEVRDSTL